MGYRRERVPLDYMVFRTNDGFWAEAFLNRRHRLKEPEPSSPEGMREASMNLVCFWQLTAPGQQNYDETHEMSGKEDQDSIRAAGVAFSLIRNNGVKEVGRNNTVRNLLSDVQVMLSQTVCAAYFRL
eukprot:1153063-Pelagomonas_calceolata.AAC.1